AINGCLGIGVIRDHIDGISVAQRKNNLFKHVVETQPMFVKILGWIVRIQTDGRQLVPVIGREHGTAPPQFEQSFLKQRSNETLPASVDSRDANEESA